jgi:TPR repeat protein
MAEDVAMWTTAANQGHVRAQHSYGAMYRSGEGVPQTTKVRCSGSGKQLIEEIPMRS